MRTASSQEHAAATSAADEGHLSISGGRSSPAATPRFHHHAPKWFQVSYFLLVVGAFVYFLVDRYGFGWEGGWVTDKWVDDGMHPLTRIFG